ncbi:ABC transporter permease [Paenibacillus ferrarius]|uniref:ABC transporter permease n=1 Tax=Paenibacillus ferrarius TaxID=1469647 RepID=A0A1V4H6R8_9BACL|nr:iron ABC transporter permease [Paenibacillus ferrarius]OPH46918.1 ABC transporter permease [Paenibacillus ferrarius]
MELSKDRGRTSSLYLRRTLNMAKSLLTNPVYLIGLLALCFLTYTIILPLWEIVKTTFLWQQHDVRVSPDAKPGYFTWYHWSRILTSDLSKSLFYKPMLNSISTSVVVSFASMALGTALAWFVTRTDVPFKKTIAFLAVVPHMLPSWILSIAWMMVFKNQKIGGSEGIFQAIFHVQPPDWLSYGYVPIVTTLTIHDSVFFYLLVAVALSSMNSQLEETASLLGAGRLTILRKITLPLVLPAILSAFILTFTKAMGSFGVPALLGLPVKYYTISTMLYSAMRNRMVTEAYILSLILMLISMLTIYLNQRMIGKRKSFVTIGGKGGRRTLTPLGKWRMPLAIGILLFMLLIGIAPLLLLVWQTFMLKDGNYSLSNLTLHWWIGESNFKIASGEVGVLRNNELLLALKNSVHIALVSSACAAVAGLILGYVVSRGRKLRLARTVEQVSFLPYLIPGISLAAIYISMFAKPTLLLPALYGTLSLIILITVVKDLPFATRAGSSAMLQIGGELEEAARMQGASWFKRFYRILLPLSRNSLISSFLIVFIGAMKEMDSIILLITPKTGTLTTLTFWYAEKGFFQLTNAIIVIIIIIIMVVYAVATKIGKADLTKGIGG